MNSNLIHIHIFKDGSLFENTHTHTQGYQYYLPSAAGDERPDEEESLFSTELQPVWGSGTTEEHNKGQGSRHTRTHTHLN